MEGQSFMWLGDSTVESETLLLKQFGDYLKCDVLQLAHHGLDGRVENCKVYNPEYAIMPSTGGLYFSYVNSAQNSWLINQSTNLKQFLVTGFGTFTTNIPLNITGSYPAHPYQSSYQNPSVIK